MGIMDAFSKEDRTEITVDQLITILNERARAEANFYIAMRMCKEGLSPATIARVFDDKKESEG